MKASAFYTVLGVGIVLVMGILWWGATHHTPTPVTAISATSDEATNTPSLTGMSIYTTGEYGFSVFYPSSFKTQSTFDTQYLLPPTWRIGALTTATGTPIVEVVGYQVRNQNSYPRYFEAVLRIGVSSDPKEVAACTQPSAEESAMPDTLIGGVSWKTFSVGDAGMSQYLKGVSYRTIHDGSCYALEQLETGSSYRDVTSSPADSSNDALTKHYTDLDAVTKSFTFARP